MCKTMTAWMVGTFTKNGILAKPIWEIIGESPLPQTLSNVVKKYLKAFQ